MKFNKKYLVFFSIIFSLFIFIPRVFAIDVGLDNVDSSIALGGESPITIAVRIINIALLFLGIIAVSLIAYAGFVWMSSEGNEEKVEKAKKLLRNSVIGLVIVLSSWGIATFVLGKIMDATGNGGNGTGDSGCIVGDIRACGLNDDCTQTCGADETWGPCSGTDCGGIEGQSCDTNSLEEGCQAGECSVGFRCGDDCKCVSTGGLGDSCNADGENEDGTCSSPDDSRCGPYLTCDKKDCTCQGKPVITSISPVGGFCKTDSNKACKTDADCLNKDCDQETGNGAAYNLITVHGYNFALANPKSAWFDDFEGYEVGSASAGFLSLSSSNNSSAAIVSDPESFSGSKEVRLSQNNNINDDTALASLNYDFSTAALTTGESYMVNFKYKGVVGNELNVNIGSSYLSPVVLGDYKQWFDYSAPFIYGNENMLRLSFDNTSGNGSEIYIDNVTISQGNKNRALVFLGQSDNEADDKLAESPSLVNSACVSTWKEKEVTVLVPAGVLVGAIKLVNDQGQSDTTDDQTGPALADFVANTISRPGLCFLDDNRGQTNDQVNYYGVNLNNSNSYFGNYKDKTKAISSNFNDNLKGDARIPNVVSGRMSSFVAASVGGVEQNSNYLSFTKESDPNLGPSISSFFPSQGPVDQYVTITGTGFGSSRGGSEVYFSTTQASYAFPLVCQYAVWSNNQIVVKAPTGLVEGDYVISVKIGDRIVDTSQNTPSKFTVNKEALKPSLCKLEPNRGPNNSPVTAWGEYFGSGEVTVRFYNNQDVKGTVIVESDGEEKTSFVKVLVPAQAISGPVSLANINGLGNSLNFTVFACVNNSDCASNEFCCPAGLDSAGRCLASEASCYSEGRAASVFEWSFSTLFNFGKNVYDSCRVMAKAEGNCITTGCPNSPGLCSPYSGNQQDLGSCDSSCNTINGCAGGVCTYDSTLNKCVLKDKSCSVIENFIDPVSNKEFQKYCSLRNSVAYWHTKTKSSCPENWTAVGSGICIDKRPGNSCSLCDSAFGCFDSGNGGICVGQNICPKDSTCINNKCITSAKTCECCCEIGKDERDCCAPLKCAGSCGSADNLGSCTGCADVGGTQADQDEACNCIGHTNKYCDSSKNVCVDCSAIGDNKDECTKHSTCCYDAKEKTCLGGSGFPSGENQGYCQYYECGDATEEASCASSTPVVSGLYKTIDACDRGCKEGDAYCAQFNNDLEACSTAGSCCFDDTSSQCKSGTAFPQASGINYAGRCQYYNCLPSPLVGCNATAVLDGDYRSESKCQLGCNSGNENPGGGAGLNCIDPNLLDSKSCSSFVCSNPFSCLAESGGQASSGDCGVCCCDPNAGVDSCRDINPKLNCQANIGSCSGAGRGLCCGCSSDGDCGGTTLTGCGIDTCCQARPTVVRSNIIPVPENESTCRNAEISLSFNQLMDPMSFNGNILIFEERDASEGVCPPGTFLADNSIIPSKQKFFARFINVIRKIIKHQSNLALADITDDNKIYCALFGNVAVDNNAVQSTIHFYPSRLLSPNTRYYVLVKGDDILEDTNSAGTVGVKSAKGVAMAERGFYDNISNTSADLVKFNQVGYANSFIWRFKTLGNENEADSGVCLIDHIELTPNSYLFSQDTDDLNENDSDPTNSTWDTKVDKDKAFTAKAYTFDNQSIIGFEGYNWDWDWDSEDENIVKTIDIANLTNIKLVEAAAGVTDASTFIRVAADMTNYLGTNVTTIGNGQVARTPVTVFICDNPWPARNSDGTWTTWQDKSDSCLPGQPDCNNYDHSFYYCRDAGGDGTFDDLPSILNESLDLGRSGTLVCSDPIGTCQGKVSGNRCGQSNRGFCIWSILKESYFFRESTPSIGKITGLEPIKEGGALKVSWESEKKDDVLSFFRIYYQLATNDGSRKIKDVRAEAPSCNLINGIKYLCSFVVDGLENNKEYLFFVTAVSDRGAESALSLQMKGTPKDKTAPDEPEALQAAGVQ